MINQSILAVLFLLHVIIFLILASPFVEITISDDPVEGDLQDEETNEEETEEEFQERSSSMEKAVVNAKIQSRVKKITKKRKTTEK